MPAFRVTVGVPFRTGGMRDILRIWWSRVARLCSRDSIAFAAAIRLISIRWGREVLDVLYPSVCLACDAPSEDLDASLCARCSALAVKIYSDACRRCGGEALPGSRSRPARCRRCTGRPFEFRRAVAALRYSGPVRELVLQVKFHRRRDGVQWLASQMESAIRWSGVDRRVSVISFVPLHPWRRVTRGFDQAELLARALSKRLGLPLARSAIWRPRRTRVQSASDPARRQTNVRGAFRPGIRRASIRGRAVLLIDDVMSSGSTVDEAAGTLLRAGARVVYVAVAAT